MASGGDKGIGIKGWIAGPKPHAKSSEPESKSVILDKHRLAVLPFANMSPDPNDSYFADGITEEIISRVSGISGLGVISRTSVMGYKSTTRNLKEIGKELEVGSVLEGSFRKAGNRIRITAQLIDVSSDQHLWSESYDRQLNDVFEVQSDVARQVANALRVKILHHEDNHINRIQTENAEAYAFYLKGRSAWNERTKEGVHKGIKYFNQAILNDSGFAAAYSGLADSYNILGANLWISPASAYPLAWKFGKKALEIEHNIAEAHASLGWTQMAYFWDFNSAEREFKNAIELNPSYATAYHWYSIMMFFLQKYEEAYSLGEQAVKLDPLARSISLHSCIYLACLGRIDRAMEGFKDMIDLDPNFAPAHFWRAGILEWQSEHVAAVEEAKEAFHLNESTLNEQFLGWAYARAGDKGEALKILDHLSAREANEYVSPVWTGMIEISLGRHKEGYRHLEESLTEPNQALLYFKGMPWLKEYRLDPSWQRIEKKLALYKDDLHMD